MSAMFTGARADSARARRTRWLVGAVTLFVVVILGAMWRSRARRATSAQPRTMPVTSSAPSRPMADMPGMVTSPSNGSASGSPAIGSPASGAVQLSADQIRQFGVTFGVAARRELTNEVRAVGVVTVDSSHIVQVAPHFGGYVERLYVNTSGQFVRRGEPLMDVYSPELLAAEQELLVAASLQRSMAQTQIPGVGSNGPDLVAAARQRLSLAGISDAQITQVLRTGRPRRALTLFSPASGVVLDKTVVQGQAIQPGQMLYAVADLGSVWVDAQLREADAGAVRPGAHATVDVAASPGHLLSGRVTYVYPTLDAAARTVRARVRVANGGGLLRPGMYATVTLASPSRVALTIPAPAVLRTGERNVIFVDAGAGRLQPTDVALGQSAGDLVEVLSGLAPGERVATSAQFLLDAESNLGDVMRSMLGQGGATASSSSMSDMPGMGMRGDRNAMSDKGADMRGMQSMQPTQRVPAVPSVGAAARRSTATPRER